MKRKLYILLVVTLCLLMYGCNNEEDRIVPGNANKVLFNSLELYVPNDFNADNSVADSYNYYINKSDDNCDISIVLKDKEVYDDSAVNYIMGKAGIKKSEIDKIKINGTSWFKTVLNKDTSEETYIYASIYDEYIYSIRYAIKTKGEICKQGLDNIDSTLYYVK